MAVRKNSDNILWRWVIPVLVLIGIGAFYFYVSGRLQRSMPEVRPVDGVVDVRDVPLEEEVYHLVNSWDFYGGILLGPEDFRDPASPPVGNPDSELSEHLGTYRVRILAKPDMYLMLGSFSIDYSMRVFVNGTEVRNFGFVSDDPAKTRHDGGYMTLPLYTGDGEVEVIYQYANAMHNDGGFIQSTVISTPENVDRFVRGMTLYSLFIGCGLVCMAFYFLVYAVYQRSSEYGVLAVCCLLIAFRNSYFTRDYLEMPGFPFEAHYRIFILIVSLIPTMVLYLTAAYFPKIVRKKTVLACSAVYAVLAVAHFVTHTRNLVALCHISYYINTVVTLAVIVRFVWYWRKRQKPTESDILTGVVILTLFLLMLWEGINTNNSSLIARFGITPFGFQLCILGLSISTNRKIRIQAEMLAEEQKKNEILGKTNAMNREFLQTVAHELRTPLSVISGYAQLIELQMQKGKPSPQAPERLHTIRSEADRLGAMVANLMAYTYGDAKEAEMHMVDPKELLHSASLIAGPVCEKKNNELRTTCRTDCMLRGNFELLLQVLINMIVNASRHTDQGVVAIDVDEEAGNVVFTVADTGTGIGEDAARHIFERGYTTDGGNGLGLAICMDTVRMHGGDLQLVSTGPNGTTFRFTIPKEVE